MMPAALFSSFFGTENARLPVGKTETPNCGFCANYILASSADWQSSG